MTFSFSQSQTAKIVLPFGQLTCGYRKPSPHPQNIEATIGPCFFALFYAYICLLFTFLAMESMNVRRDWLGFQSGSQSGNGKKKRKYFLPRLFI
jgi:hypothetical protein